MDNELITSEKNKTIQLLSLLFSKNIPEINESNYYLYHLYPENICRQCSSIPFLININFNTDKIIFNCKNHGIIELDIHEFIYKIREYSIDFNKCSKCFNRKIYFYNGILRFCCKCNKIFCTKCILHEHNNFAINLEEINNKCKIHFNENYKYFCDNCYSLLCEICCNRKDDHIDHNIINIDEVLLLNDYKDVLKNYSIIINECDDYELLTLNNFFINSYIINNHNYFYIFNFKNYLNILKDKKVHNEIKSKVTQIKKLSLFNKKYSANCNISDDNINLKYKNLTDSAFNFFAKIKFINDFKELYFHNNKIKNISLLKIMQIQNLSILDFSNNLINNINILSEINFTNLTKLDLSNNKINNISAFKKIKFKNLQRLSLSNNSIKDITALKYCFSNDKLRELFLYDNQISCVDIFEEKIIFQNLEILFLQKNEIQDINVIFRGDFNKMKELYLHNNLINDLNGLFNVNGFQELQELFLQGNNINDLRIFEHINLPSLSKLFLQNNKINYNIIKNKDIIQNLKYKIKKVLF